MLVIFQGPSCAGKTTLTKACGLPILITYTTREKRVDETNGVDYHFISLEEFKALDAEQGWATYEIIQGDYYGMTKVQLELLNSSNVDCCIALNRKGSDAYTRHVDNVIIIGVKCNEEEIKRRLKERYGSDEFNYYKHFRTYNKDVANLTNCDLLINNDLELGVVVDFVKAFIAEALQAGGLLMPDFT